MKILASTEFVTGFPDMWCHILAGDRSTQSSVWLARQRRLRCHL